jgi:hypothetical protein
MSDLLGSPCVASLFPNLFGIKSFVVVVAAVVVWKQNHLSFHTLQ